MMETIVNIVLSVLSFALASISVVTVVISLKQNGRMLKQNEIQLEEMKKEYSLSKQPVLVLSNPEFLIERPRLFYTPPTKEYSIKSRYALKIDVQNVSSAIALNININACYVLNQENKGDSFFSANTYRINVLAEGKESVDFLFVGDVNGKTLESLREESVRLRPRIRVSASFSNPSGGYFKTTSEYIVCLDSADTLKAWHSIVASAEADYKQELYVLRNSDDEEDLFGKIQDDIVKKAGQELKLVLRCVEIPESFKYETLTPEQFDKILKKCHYARYVGDGTRPICKL